MEIQDTVLHFIYISYKLSHRNQTHILQPRYGKGEVILSLPTPPQLYPTPPLLSKCCSVIRKTIPNIFQFNIIFPVESYLSTILVIYDISDLRLIAFVSTTSSATTIGRQIYFSACGTRSGIV